MSSKGSRLDLDTRRLTLPRLIPSRSAAQVNNNLIVQGECRNISEQFGGEYEHRDRLLGSFGKRRRRASFGCPPGRLFGSRNLFNVDFVPFQKFLIEPGYDAIPRTRRDIQSRESVVPGLPAYLAVFAQISSGPASTI